MGKIMDSLNESIGIPPKKDIKSQTEAINQIYGSLVSLPDSDKCKVIKAVCILLGIELGDSNQNRY